MFALGLSLQGIKCSTCHSAVLYEMGVSFDVKIMEAQTKRVIAFLMSSPAWQWVPLHLATTCVRWCCAPQLGDHRAALRILALTLGDIRLAEAYCARFTGHDGHLMLLDLLLHPGDERPPLYIEACHLLAAQGIQPS